MLLKKAKETWKGTFDKVLASSEKKEFANARRYYESEYNKAIAEFLKTRKGTGFDDLFRVADLSDIYRQIYVNIGLKFAKWYSKNFDKVISKTTDVSGYEDIWADRFNRVSQQIAAERVTLVQGTAKATLVNVFKRLSSDPEFMVMGEYESGRILRQKFSQYSKSQAERLIRTESTNAANYATLQSATDMFGQENLQKEWMTSIDGRERAAHRGADGQIIDFKERFLVGGEQLFHPGDPAGSARNVINCRCSTAPFPKAEAQAAGTIEGFGVRPPGLSSGAKPPKIPAQSVLRTPKPVREVVEEVKPKPKGIIPAELQDKINKGWDLGDLSYLDNLADESINFRFATKSSGARCSNYNPRNKQVTIVLGKRYLKKGKNLNQVVAHEYGHALHHSKGWITHKAKGRSYILDGDFDDDVIKHYKNQNKKIQDKIKSNSNYFDKLIYPKGGSDYKKNLNTYWKNFHDSEEMIIKKYGITKEQHQRQFEAMHDYFGAITREKLGGGHGFQYYQDGGVTAQMAEIFANAHDFYYTDNVVFKELYPEYYKDSIDYIKKMLDKL